MYYFVGYGLWAARTLQKKGLWGYKGKTKNGKDTVLIPHNLSGQVISMAGFMQKLARDIIKKIIHASPMR
jgi:hypothetical protein